MITTNILAYVIPALLMILVTQLTRNMFTKSHDGRKTICNGARWLLILVACIPIVNTLALTVECCIIAYNITEGEYAINSGKNSKFLKWWRK